jgi:hypothetical protein
LQVAGDIGGLMQKVDDADVEGRFDEDDIVPPSPCEMQAFGQIITKDGTTRLAMRITSPDRRTSR